MWFYVSCEICTITEPLAKKNKKAPLKVKIATSFSDNSDALLQMQNKPVKWQCKTVWLI